MFKFEKLGVIAPQSHADWCNTHWYLMCVKRDRQTLRIFFGGTNEARQSRIGYFDVGFSLYAKSVLFCEKLILDFGDTGEN